MGVKVKEVQGVESSGGVEVLEKSSMSSRSMLGGVGVATSSLSSSSSSASASACAFGCVSTWVSRE